MQALLPEEQHEIDEANEASLKVQYHISKSRNNPLNVYTFVLANPDDPAKKVRTCWYCAHIMLTDLPQNFICSLKDHLLGRLLKRSFDGDTHATFTPEDRLTVCLQNQTIFQVSTARINYTTYDL